MHARNEIVCLNQQGQSGLVFNCNFYAGALGSEQRNFYIKQLDDAFHMLGRSPELGKSCDDIMPGYRKFPQGSHIVFYKDGSTSKIEVIRILHKSMDVETKIQGA